MAEKLGMGIVGCGDIAVQEAEAIVRARNMELVVVMDVNPKYAENLGRDFGVPFTADLEELLARRDVEAVVVSTPNHLHAPIAIQAAQAGKHVVAEKPMAMDLEEADAMTEACRSHGVTLSVAYCYRYWPWVRKARELVRRGVIGEVTGINTVSMSMKPSSYWAGGYSKRVATDWRKDRARSGGGVFAMNITHNLDYLYFITGLEVERIYTEYGTLATDVGVEDFISATLRYSNGAIGSINAGSAAAGGGANEDRIYGARGQIVLGDPLMVYVTEAPPVSDKAADPVRELIANQWNEVKLDKIRDKWVEPRRRYFEELADAIRTGGEPPVGPRDGRRGVALIRAAYRSGETHAAVALREAVSGDSRKRGP
jgi:predicted dehydrogenase